MEILTIFEKIMKGILLNKLEEDFEIPLFFSRMLIPLMN
jgi:hypothetical protein